MMKIKKGQVVIRPEQDVKEFLKDFFNIKKLNKRLPWRKMKEELEERHEIR